MTYNTGNPIGSTDARDRSDNSENLDLAVNSLSQTFVDRLGVTRDTLEGIYQKSAYYRAGTFDAGYTLTNNRQTLAYGNIEYSWAGEFPKVVAAGATPATSGGIGAGAWVDRTDATLRDELLASVLKQTNGARFALRDFISVKDYGAVADYDVATKTINSNSTQAFKDAITAAQAKNGTVFIPSAPNGKAYYITDTLYPHYYSGVGTNPSGQDGAYLLGENRTGSYLVFDLPDNNAVGIHIFGTSGHPSNLGYENLTIRPHVNGRGVGVKEQGPCVIRSENIDIQEFDTNLYISNGVSAGIFTEFGSHRRMWIKNGNTDIKFRADGGDASFHGCNFEHLIVNTKSGAVGIDIGTGCYIYNALWHGNMFAPSDAKFILNNGSRNGTDNLFFEGDGMVENFGNYSVRGNWRIESADGTLTWGGSKPVAVENLLTPTIPDSGRFTSLGTDTKITALSDIQTENAVRNFVGIRATDVESVGVTVYEGGDADKNGFAILSCPFGGGPKDLELIGLIHRGGLKWFDNAPKFSISNQPADITQLQLNDNGYHTGSMGRVSTASIAANAGVSQSVTVPLCMAEAGQHNLVNIRFTAAGAAHDTTHTYLMAANPYGSSAAATLLATNNFVSSAGFVAPSSVVINSSGLVQFSITTSVALTATVKALGIGVY